MTRVRVGGLVVLAGLLLAAAASAAPAARPNIVLIMLDDLGYADLGCYGSEIETPNIDALAAGGLRFSRFYNTAKCHTSRIALLTGQYANRAGGAAMDRGVTIAEVLGRAGYGTAMVGKWHLRGEPTDRGFGRYFGHLSGATNFFRGDQTFRLNGRPWSGFDADFYTTDANTGYAKRFIGELQAEDAERPFFLYVAHNAPHYPLQVREEDFRKYERRYAGGWDAARAARVTKQRSLGLYPDRWEAAPRPENVPAWDDLSDDDRAWEARRMAAYAGMVDRVDRVTGDLVNYLDAQGVLDNTLIMLCSDNGACPFDRTRGRDLEPWDPDSYWTYDTGWSHVGNTPFRLHKQNQHEGGVATPMIVHWPGGLTARPGSITPQPGHLIDVMATCLDVAGVDYPDAWTGVELGPMRGASLRPVFRGETREPHDELYFQFGTNRAVRSGNWKLVSHRAARWELYDIEADGTETRDLASEHPEVVERLAERWHALAEADGLAEKLSAPVSSKAPPALEKDGRPVAGGGS